MKYLKRLLAITLTICIVFSQSIFVLAAPTPKSTAKYTISLNKSVYTIKKGSNVKLKATMSAAARKKGIRWSSSNTKVATVSSKGKITAKKNGKTTITAKIKGTKIKAVCKLIVGKPVRKIKLNKTKNNIAAGKTFTIKATLTPKKPTNKRLTYKSSNTKVAAVSSKGIVKAINSGTALITVRSADGSGAKAVCRVTVKAYLSKKNVTLAKGDSTVVSLKGATIKSVKTSDSSVATINKKGKITAIGEGSVTLTITDSRGEKHTCTVTVISNDEDFSVDNTPVTREQWISELIDVLNLSKTSDNQYSFDDYDQVAQPDNIETAIRYGIVEVVPDEDNMCYFNPAEYVTREYAAHTAVSALNYCITNADELPVCSDQENLKYSDQDRLAVKLGMLKFSDNQFLPAQNITTTEKNNIIAVVEKILNETEVSDEFKGTVTYADEVEKTTVDYELDEDDTTVTIYEAETVAGWQPGEVHILESANGDENDVAIKISNIWEDDGITYVSYTEPELGEVVKDFDIEGTAHSDEATFTPAEGVTAEVGTALRSSRIQAFKTTEGSVPVPAFNNIKLSLNIDNVSFNGTLNIKDIEYRFSADPSWHIVTIHEAYVAVNSTVEGKVDYKLFSSGEKSIELGTVNCPIGYGFSIGCNVYLAVKADGKVGLSYSMTCKTGVQYTEDSGIRPISEITSEVQDVEFKASAKMGLKIAPNGKFLGMDLVKVDATGGVAFDGKTNNANLSEGQFCLEGKAYLFVSLGAQIGPDQLNIKADFDVINLSNTPWKLALHFEETGRVLSCTRGSGTYEGYVKQSDHPDIGIGRAKIQVFRDSALLDTTYTDNSGKFAGIELPSGTYVLHVSASGYVPYEKTFQIIGGNTTTLETQLMIGRDSGTASEYFMCGGKLMDAYNGMAVENASINAYSQTIIPGSSESVSLSAVGSTSSDSDGNYSFVLPAGIYKLIVSKDGYVNNMVYVTVNADRSDVNIALNPTNLPSINGNLRVVLTWGEKPSDLDSHMTTEVEGDNYHVYFDKEQSGNLELDWDVTESYGPETITVKDATEGVYHYYVHDYTNKGDSYSTELSKSGAQLKLYAGETLLYTIDVPADREGTLWHVFDYDAKTDQISLVNEFSYESHPSHVGSTTVEQSLRGAGQNDEKGKKIQLP